MGSLMGLACSRLDPLRDMRGNGPMGSAAVRVSSWMMVSSGWVHWHFLTSYRPQLDVSWAPLQQQLQAQVLSVLMELGSLGLTCVLLVHDCFAFIAFLSETDSKSSCINNILTNY